MARIREILRRTDEMRIPLRADRPSPPSHQPEELPSCAEEEVPFIEVGGRDTPVEASPSVLANHPPVLHKNPQAEPSPPERVGTRRGATEVRLTVLHVSFCTPGD